MQELFWTFFDNFMWLVFHRMWKKMWETSAFRPFRALFFAFRREDCGKLLLKCAKVCGKTTVSPDARKEDVENQLFSKKHLTRFFTKKPGKDRVKSAAASAGTETALRAGAEG